MDEVSAHTVLVVEDEPVIELATRMFLQQAGYTVITARDGEDAVASSGDAHLIVMDINLGAGITGVEAAQRISARRRVPILFYSAYNLSRLPPELIPVVSDAYVSKTDGPESLLTCIQEALR